MYCSVLCSRVLWKVRGQIAKYLLGPFESWMASHQLWLYYDTEGWARDCLNICLQSLLIAGCISTCSHGAKHMTNYNVSNRPLYISCGLINGPTLLTSVWKLAKVVGNQQMWLEIGWWLTVILNFVVVLCMLHLCQIWYIVTVLMF